MPVVSCAWTRSLTVDLIMWLPVCWCVVCSWIFWIPCVGGTTESNHRIHWNASNAMFHASNNDHVIDVNLGDTIDIICPHYNEEAGRANSYEYYVVYMVNQTDYEACIINDTPQKMKILNCSSPSSQKPKVYTMLVLDFQPIQGNPDFQEGSSYYFISTSGGGAKEMNNQFKGACHTHRMKMILRVIPHDNSKPGTTRVPSTTPGRGSVPPSRTTTTTTPSTTTTPRPSPTTKRTGPPTNIPTNKPGGGGAGFPNEGDNVIHVGGGGGDKNEGTITDSGCGPLRPSPSLLVLWLLAGLLCCATATGVLR